MLVPSENFTSSLTPGGGIRVTAARGGLCRIYWSSSPDGFTDDNELEAFEGETIFPNPLGERRCFLHIVRDHEYSVTSPRVLITDGLHNLRDIGGYNTEDGKYFLKYGRLYRSEMIIADDEALTAAVKSIRPKRILDFRYADEVVMEGADPEFDFAEYLNLPVLPEEKPEYIMGAGVLQTLGTGLIRELHGMLIGSYRRMPFSTDTWRRFFRLILEERFPILCHCTAGKDRTGVAIALLLLALGIPRATIVHDYMLTNETRALQQERRAASFVPGKGQDESTRLAFRDFFAVAADSIGSALDAVTERYPDTGEYFRTELGLTQEDISSLKALLLCPHNMTKL